MIKDTLVVSVDDFSMDTLLKKNFYATAKKFSGDIKFIAFYQKMPISAITHYAEIDKIMEGNVDDVGVNYWIRNFPERKPPYTIIKLKELKRLRSPIKRDTNIGVQSPVYTSINLLKSAKVLSNLF